MECPKGADYMHNIFGVERHLSKITTSLCVGGGSGSVIFSANGVIVKNDISCIDENCFDKRYIGPGGYLIFKGFVKVGPHAITSPLFKDIVFEQDASLNENAFFSKLVNSNLYKNFILYSKKGGNVERFAKEHGFTFKELNSFKLSSDSNNYCLVCQYKRNIEFSRGTKRIYVNEDRFIFLDKAKKKNGNYVFFQSPFINGKYLKEAETILNHYEKDKKHMLYTGIDQKWFYVTLNIFNVKKYVAVLEKTFGHTEVFKYLRRLKRI